MRQKGMLRRAVITVLCGLGMAAICNVAAPITAEAAESTSIIIGTVTYDSSNPENADGSIHFENGILTLNNATIDGAIENNTGTLTIKLIGNNTVTARRSDYGALIERGGNLTIEGTGSLVLDANYDGSSVNGNYGIITYYSIYINNAVEITIKNSDTRAVVAYDSLVITPPENGRTEVKVGSLTDGADAAAWDQSPIESVSTFDGRVLNGNCYAYIKGIAATPEEPEDKGSTSKAATWQPGKPCQHVYEWEVYEKATATKDGIMRYRCKYCGEVEYSVPTAAYYVFNKEAQESIQKAAQGAAVKVSTPIFISFHEMVKDALVARPDVTLVVDYKNAGKSYEMTIPAGSGDQLTTLFGDSQYAGFLYLGGAFATVEK